MNALEPKGKKFDGRGRRGVEGVCLKVVKQTGHQMNASATECSLRNVGKPDQRQGIRVSQPVANAGEQPSGGRGSMILLSVKNRGNGLATPLCNTGVTGTVSATGGQNAKHS